MVEVQSAVTERDFMLRPNQLYQVDVCRHDASQNLEATRPLPGNLALPALGEFE
jgi:hypothetical protein